MARESIIMDESSSSLSRPTTLLLRTNRPYFYNTWRLNNRLRIENEKLFKRQQSSCSCAFYSLCLCVIGGILIIVIYRFTDECSSINDWKNLSQLCRRYWLFFAATFLSLISCCGFLAAACRYFRTQPANFPYENQRLTELRNPNEIFPTVMTPHYYGTPVLLGNGSSINSSRYRDDEHSNITLNSSSTVPSPQRRIPPFIYDELPSEATSIRISISPPMDFEHYPRISLTTNSNTSPMEDIYLKTPSSHSNSNVWQKRSNHS